MVSVPKRKKSERGFLCLALLFSWSACASPVPEGSIPAIFSPRDAIVVLGNRPPTDEHGEIRAELRARLERGIELFHAGAAPQMVFAGGADRRGVIEAVEMRHFAEERGVPPEAILTDEESQDTVENARNTLEKLCRGTSGLCAPSIWLVTSAYHLPRAEMLFRCAGARVRGVASAGPESHSSGAAGRERLVWLFYGFQDVCRRARPRL